MRTRGIDHNQETGSLDKLCQSYTQLADTRTVTDEPQDVTSVLDMVVVLWNWLGLGHGHEQ